MKKATFLMLVLFFQAIALFSQIPEEIQNEKIIGINKLPARTMIWPSPDIENAKIENYDQSIWVKSLNGEWKFNWSPDPQSRPVDFYNPEYSVSSWETIELPTTLEAIGYGTPIYTNYIYPFNVSNPPLVMETPNEKYTSYYERNPVGSFRRAFSIPQDWKGKQIILHLAGASSGTFVWINGNKVGYSQDSRLPAEFDITPFLKSEGNEIAIETYKYCDGSYLEDQDYWRMSGIYRDVFVRAVPKIALWDIYSEPKVNLADKKGSIQIRYTPVNFTEKSASKYSLRVSVVSPYGEEVIENEIFPLKAIPQGMGEEIILPEINLGEVELWFNETPICYDVYTELMHGNEVVEAYKLPVAFRKIEVEGNTIFLNNRQLKVRGVNRHEFSPLLGWTINKQSMEKDLCLMKQGNVNFVRNAHYPNDPRWYSLCNQYGIMVIDEANVESHGLSYHKKVLPGDNPSWGDACVDRMERMVVRARQQPALLMWSLGNEAGYGEAFMRMREVTMKNDPEKRLIQYADMNLAADVDSQTYPTVGWLNQHLEGKAERKGERGEISVREQHGKYPSGRPFLMNEYCHAMGNSLGNFIDYWEVIYQNDIYAGGFIWDWVDQTFYKNKKDASEGYLYGGDFGDFPNNANFCINGLVNSDRVPYPHYYEMKKVYQPAAILLTNTNPLTIKVINRNIALNLNQFTLSYELLEDGVAVSQGILPSVDIAPLESGEIVLKEEQMKYDVNKECLLTIRFELNEECIWARKGHVIAWEQLDLTNKTHILSADRLESCSLVDASIEKSTNENHYLLKGENYSIKIDRKTGMLSEYIFNGKTLIRESTRFNFWRAWTDNDRGWNATEVMNSWVEDSRNPQLTSIKELPAEGNYIAFESGYLFEQTNATGKLIQKIYPNGQILIDFSIDIPSKAPDIPRIGLSFEVEKSLNSIEWHGRGPQENYLDRKTGAPIGVYSSTINDWTTPYVRPQENGNRSDIRQIRFSNDEVSLLFVGVDNTFSASAWPYTQDVLDEIEHDFDLIEHSNSVVNIDCTQMGVGGDSSWGLPVMNHYKIKPNKYNYRFVILAEQLRVE